MGNTKRQKGIRPSVFFSARAQRQTLETDISRHESKKKLDCLLEEREYLRSAQEDLVNWSGVKIGLAN